MWWIFLQCTPKLYFIIITSMPRPGALLSSRIASMYSDLGLAGTQWTGKYLRAGSLTQLYAATLSLVCQLDVSSPLEAVTWVSAVHMCCMLMARLSQGDKEMQSTSCNVFQWREVFTACYKYVSAWFLLYQFNMNISVSFPFQTVQSENFTLCDVTVLGVFAKCKVYWEFLKSNTETYEKHNLCKAADCQRITLADTRVSIRESIHQHSKQFAWQHNIH